jgi:hypothetical protein
MARKGFFGDISGCCQHLPGLQVVNMKPKDENMRYRQEIKVDNNPFSLIIGIVMLAVFFMALFYLARFVFTILYYLSPVLFVAALIIDYKVVLGYLQWLGGLFRRNPIIGILAIVLSVVGFPVLAAFLLGKALVKKRVRDAQDEAQRAREGEYADFEELEIEDEPEPKQPLRQASPRSEAPHTNQYDDFFKE